MQTDIVPLLESHIREIPDFPKPGIRFKDITPLLSDSKALNALVNYFHDRYRHQGVTKIVGVESRGFIIGSALAYAMGVGLILVRKPGKLPSKKLREDYALEYGTDALEIHEDALTDKDNVVIMDDLLATGGTASATGRLVTRLGASIHEFAFLSELAFLKGAAKLSPHTYHALLKF